MSTQKINKVQIKVNKLPPNVNQNNCSGCGGGGGQGLSTVDPRQYPATRMYPDVPGMFPGTPIPNNCAGFPTRPDPGPITSNRG